MAVHEDREAFIPYRRTDLIELCLEDGQLSEQDVPKFREFCSILSAYYHFQFHTTLEALKDNYDPFNPDSDSQPRVALTALDKREMAKKVATMFSGLVQSANYIRLSKDNLRKAFQEESLIELKTDVDFNDFEEMVCYYQGDSKEIIKTKKWFREIEKEIKIFERVALLIKFREESYFRKKKADLQKLNFQPGKMYVYLYKNIPKYDLEFLFPNVKTSMTWKDRLLFGIPAIGAAIPIFLKIIPQLLLLVGIILFFTIGFSPVEELQVSEEDVEDFMPILVAALSLVITLGGFAFKQYTSYKNKQIKFQKNVTETLFFRNLASNIGVFQWLIDAAEEEECKEVILVYYHLLTHSQGLTPEQLDDHIESWMEEKFGTIIDFDINDALRKLQTIQGNLNGDENLVPLLSYDEKGCCQVLPLEKAITVIDYIWDNAFLYSK